MQRIALLAGLACALLAPAAASADLASLKEACGADDAADADIANGVSLPYRFCDDGLPPVGGRTPNDGALNAVAVPESYGGYEGLPAKTEPRPDSGADGDGNIALDVNVALPARGKFKGKRPLVILMHGCCSGSKSDWHGTIDKPGEKWHYTDAWFAARGYVALTYTSRGFVDANGRGSTGETFVDHRSFEVNDLQHLAAQLADDPFFKVDPKRIVVTGGSYGGGLSWMVLTDPVWRSPEGKRLRLAAVAPKYGWTDLVYSLVPNGSHLQGTLPAFSAEASDSVNPVGTPKRSFTLALYASGTGGLPPPGAHATFIREIDEGYRCLASGDPVELNPLCAGFDDLLASFIADRSAYYQDRFWSWLERRRRNRVPIFSAGAFSDALFTMVEHRRMLDRLKSVDRRYPIQQYYGDYNHAVQNKAKEWGDLCGEDHHVCTFDDYFGAFPAPPEERVRVGVTSRLNDFIDAYASPDGGAPPRRPRRDVTVSLQTCRDNATGLWPLDEPGQRFTAPTIEALARHRLRLEFAGNQTLLSNAEPNPHAAAGDPVFNSVSNAATCPSHSDPAGPGVATYDSEPLAGDITMIGQTAVRVVHSGAGSDPQLVARVYDLYPDGTQVLVDRGSRKLTDPNGTTEFDLHGNGWRFPEGHRVRIELAQDDDPYLKASNQLSSLTVSQVEMSLPVREPAPGRPGRSGPTVRLFGTSGRKPRIGVYAIPAAQEETGVDRYEFRVRRRGRWRPLEGRLNARKGRRYLVRGRAIDVRGVPGQWARKRVRWHSPTEEFERFCRSNPGAC